MPLLEYRISFGSSPHFYHNVDRSLTLKFLSARRNLKRYNQHAVQSRNEPLEEVWEEDRDYELEDTYMPTITIQEGRKISEISLCPLPSQQAFTTSSQECGGSKSSDEGSKLPGESWLLTNPFHPDFRSTNPFRASSDLNPFANPFRPSWDAELGLNNPSSPEKVTNPFEPGFIFNPFLPGAIFPPRSEVRTRFGNIRRCVVSAFRSLRAGRRAPITGF